MLLVLCMVKPMSPIYSQISDIKELASGAADLFSGCTASDITAGCDAFNCIWNVAYLFLDFVVNHHQEIMDRRYLNPGLFSFEVDAGFAGLVHYSGDDLIYYQYVNYLPHIRGNLGIFSTDFRFNLLAEYTNDLPDSYRSWDLIFILNLVPVNSFKMSFGTGLYGEMYTQEIYNEHYFQMQFGLFENKDFIDIDTRVAVDYATSLIPFMEASARYKWRFISFDHANAYLSLGGLYQNYYQEHILFGGSAGVLLNFH